MEVPENVITSSKTAATRAEKRRVYERDGPPPRDIILDVGGRRFMRRAWQGDNRFGWGAWKEIAYDLPLPHNQEPRPLLSIAEIAASMPPAERSDQAYVNAINRSGTHYRIDRYMRLSGRWSDESTDVGIDNPPRSLAECRADMDLLVRELNHPPGELRIIRCTRQGHFVAIHG